MTEMQKLKNELAAKDQEIAALTERLKTAARRIAGLIAGTYPLTASGLPPSDFDRKTGVERIAAGMKLPTTTPSDFDQRVSANAARIRASRLAN